MTDPNQSRADLLKQGFEKLKEGADFYQMGPLLIDILKQREEVDISDSDLKDAFQMVIQYHLNDDKLDKALLYMVRSFAVDGITEKQRLEFNQTVIKLLEEREEELVWDDYSDVIKLFRRQIKFLQIYSNNDELIAQLNFMDGKLSAKQMYTQQREEGPMREYITGLLNLYYQSLPDQESLDYASQIILESKK